MANETVLNRIAAALENQNKIMESRDKRIDPVMQSLTVFFETLKKEMSDKTDAPKADDFMRTWVYCIKCKRQTTAEYRASLGLVCSDCESTDLKTLNEATE